jgi:hypothetical protein
MSYVYMTLEFSKGVNIMRESGSISLADPVLSRFLVAVQASERD